MKSKYKIEDWVSKQFGLWIVLGFSHTDEKNQQYWICRCRGCGLEKPIRTSTLFRTLNRSCSRCRPQSKDLKNSPYWKGGEFISASQISLMKNSANRRSIPFNITIEELERKWKEQNGKCAYTNELLTLPSNTRDKDFNASVDRIDSKLPYSYDNIHWVIKDVNLMKMSLKEDRFLELCKKIAKKF